jgi:ribonuclease P protein component
LDQSRFGIVASKRIGNAVTRNRVRRLVSEALRAQCDLVSPGWDVVLIVRRGILGADYWAVEHSVTRLLGMARLFDAAPGESGAVIEGRQ